MKEILDGEPLYKRYQDNYEIYSKKSALQEQKDKIAEKRNIFKPIDKDEM